MRIRSDCCKKGVLMSVIVLYAFFMMSFSMCAKSLYEAFDVKFSGYIKYENWIDTRQVVALRDGEYHLYPQKKKYDVLGADTMAKGQYNASTLQTRIRADFVFPLVIDPKINTVFEGDFWGISTSFPMYRMRHLYATMQRGTLSVLVGQTWHPFFLPDCFPNTLGFNTGVPIEVYSRQPQLRVAYVHTKNEFSCSFIAQQETTSSGPIGPSTTYLHNNIIPNVNIQWIGRGPYDSLISLSADVVRIIPRLATKTGESIAEAVTAVRGMIAAKVGNRLVEVKAKALYVENGYDLTMLGGYGVSAIDPISDHRKYMPTRACSLWGECILKKTIEPALFVGWTKNLGSAVPLIIDSQGESLLYTRGSDIDTVIRISPRVRWYAKPLILACEMEYTCAYYGIVTPYARASHSYPVGNFRWMFSLFYLF